MTAVTQEQDPAPAKAGTKGGSPTREYVVLEQVVYDEDEANGTATHAWLDVHRVEARNGTNALRKAFKELRAARAEVGEQLDEGVLNCIPAGQWKPTPVRAKKRESITVDLG